MSRTFYILCGNTAYNRGDRVNLTAQIALLRSRYPEARILVGSYRAEIDRKWYDAEVRQRPLLFSLPFLKDLMSADVIIWGGGALLADNAGVTLVPYWYFLILFIRLALKKPIVAWAHGIVLETRIGRFFARRALELTDAITVRDQGSFYAVKDLRIRDVPVTLTSDPAILAESGTELAGERALQSLGVEPDGRLIFGIVPTFWPFFHRPGDLLPYLVSHRLRAVREAHDVRLQRYRDALREVGERLAERYDAHIVYLPRYPSGPWPDTKYLQEMTRNSGYSRQLHVLEGDGLTPKEYLSIFHHATLVISTALHDAIFCAALEIPCVQIQYEKKCGDFQRAIGSPQAEIDLDQFLGADGPDTVLREVERIIRDREQYLRIVQPGVQRLRQRAVENLDILSQVIERVSVYQPARSRLSKA